MAWILVLFWTIWREKNWHCFEDIETPIPSLVLAWLHLLSLYAFRKNTTIFCRLIYINLEYPDEWDACALLFVLPFEPLNYIFACFQQHMLPQNAQNSQSVVKSASLRAMNSGVDSAPHKWFYERKMDYRPPLASYLSPSISILCCLKFNSLLSRFILS